MSCRTYDPCLDSKLNQIGSYAAAARSSAQNAAASAEQSEDFSQASAFSAGQSATSATNAATSATNAANSASEANNYLTQVTNIFNDFDERYLGAKNAPPATDNQGNPLQEGALYWNSVTNAMFVWNGSAWEPAFSDMPTGGGSDKVFYLNDNQVTVDYTIPAGKNAMSAGPITVIPGVTVTVPPGQSWTPV